MCVEYEFLRRYKLSSNKTEQLEAKQEKCNFYDKVGRNGLSDWCYGKDNYCDGWCTC